MNESPEMHAHVNKFYIMWCMKVQVWLILTISMGTKVLYIKITKLNK